MEAHLTLGPILFNWNVDVWKDFYFRVADEMPVERAYIGEVICSKRSPFFEEHYFEIAERLQKAGKKVIFSTLAEIMIPRERKMTQSVCSLDEYAVEANDAAALFHLRGKPHHVGQYVNTYNEDTMEYLVKNGARHFTLPVELPAEAIKKLAEKAGQLQAGCEVMVFGRAPLALSARCYHARAHNRIKDTCQFICEEDPDGMELKTADGKPFLAINGVQTLSHTYLNLMQEIPDMLSWGVRYFRLSPHTMDMVAVANLFKEVLDGKLEPPGAILRLKELGGTLQYSNGFFHHQPGYQWRKTG